MSEKSAIYRCRKPAAVVSSFDEIHRPLSAVLFVIFSEAWCTSIEKNTVIFGNVASNGRKSLFFDPIQSNCCGRPSMSVNKDFVGKSLQIYTVSQKRPPFYFF